MRARKISETTRDDNKIKRCFLEGVGKGEVWGKFVAQNAVSPQLGRREWLHLFYKDTKRIL